MKHLAKKLLLDHPEDIHFPMVAIALKGRRICGYGYNSFKTNPLGFFVAKKYGLGIGEDTDFFNASTHCELSALSKFPHCDTLFIARLKKDGTFGIAKPCPVCQKMLELSSIKLVYFTTSYGTIKKEKIC